MNTSLLQRAAAPIVTGLVAFCLGLEPLLRSKSPLPDSWRLPPVDPSLGFGPEAALRWLGRVRAAARSLAARWAAADAEAGDFPRRSGWLPRIHS